MSLSKSAPPRTPSTEPESPRREFWSESCLSVDSLEEYLYLHNNHNITVTEPPANHFDQLKPLPAPDSHNFPLSLRAEDPPVHYRTKSELINIDLGW